MDHTKSGPGNSSALHRSSRSRSCSSFSPARRSPIGSSSEELLLGRPSPAHDRQSLSSPLHRRPIPGVRSSAPPGRPDNRKSPSGEQSPIAGDGEENAKRCDAVADRNINSPHASPHPILTGFDGSQTANFPNF